MDAQFPPMVIDVVSDVVCPWCYIGKRHLESALAGTPEAEAAAVRWHPFELNPDLPLEGVDRRSYLEAKFGGPARAAEIYARVREAGARAGIAFDFDAIRRQPNTRDAHRLIAWAQSHGDANALVERLFHAYFTEGRFVGDRETLIALAAEVGLAAGEARDCLESGQGAEAIAAAEARARTLGIDGVPFFVFGGKVALSGAQPPETMREAIAQARAGPRG